VRRLGKVACGSRSEQQRGSTCRSNLCNSTRALSGRSQRMWTQRVRNSGRMNVVANRSRCSRFGSRLFALKSGLRFIDGRVARHEEDGLVRIRHDDGPALVLNGLARRVLHVTASTTGRRPGKKEGPTQATDVKDVEVVRTQRSAEIVSNLDESVPVDLAVVGLRSAVLDELHRSRGKDSAPVFRAGGLGISSREAATTRPVA
jgi:hypothetical protein